MHRMPVFHDDQNFRDRTQRMFREMEEKMGFASLNDPSWSMPSVGGWSTAYDPRFFELWPTTTSTSSSVGQSQVVGKQPQDPDAKPFEILDDATMRSLFVDLDQGRGSDGDGRLFRMSFDMRQYNPENIVVRTENDCLVVEAKYVEDQSSGAPSAAGGSKVVRQFCRRIQLPPGVDPMKLTSTLSADSILTVQAPVPPSYNSITSAPNQLQQQQPPPSSLTSSQQTTVRQQQQQLQAPVNVGTTTGRTSPFQTIQQQQQQHVYQNRASPIPTAASYQPPITQQHLSAQLQPPTAGVTAGGRVSPRFGAVAVQPPPLAVDLPTFTVDPSTGRRRLDLAVDLGPPYTADDVAVRLEGHRLTIEARHENHDPTRSRVSTTSTQKQFDIGEDVDPATVRASLSDAGRLTVVAYVQ